VQTIDKLKAAGMKIQTVSFERTDDLQFVDLSIHAAFKNWKTYYDLERALETDAEFELMATRE
jgi:hypothetical protein